MAKPPLKVVLLHALKAVCEVRPANWDDGEDPALTEAYRSADAAIAAAEQAGLSMDGRVVVDASEPEA